MAAITTDPGAMSTQDDPVPFLMKLYPAPWRARYGAEFAELLAARPPSARDRVDIVRGAIDARLRPQTPGARPDRVATRGDRVLALAAASVGALFSIWAGIIVVYMPRWGAGNQADDALLAASFGAGLLGAFIAIGVLVGLAFRHIEDMRSAGTIGALVAALGFLGITGDGDAPGLALIALGTLGMTRGLARATGWRVAGFMVGATLFLSAAVFGFISSSGQELLWLSMLIGYGPAWMLLGASLRRGARVRMSAPLAA